uniref:HAT C-terminal dimerisation domain-containing protein n=1 Tax=Cyprinus carpio TaxID=7962 RepID=A0A8C1TZ08_CYPCA
SRELLKTLCELCFEATRELQHLSDTCWACRFLALRNIMDTLPALKRLLQEIAQERHGERTVEARGLLAQIELEFVLHLVTLRKLFGETKLLSDMLQSQTVDLSRAVDLESSFDKLWDEALNICEQCDSATSEAKRQKMLSSRLSGYCTLSTVVQREVERDKDMFRTSFFYPVIDSMLNELNRRFSNTNCELMRSIQSLSPQSDAFLKESDVFHLAVFLIGEVKKPYSTVELVCFIEPYREVFFELFRLCKIAVTLPVSSASCEHSVSTMKLIKTFLLSTTTDERLSDLGVLSIESRRAKPLDLDVFVDRFSSQHNRRILLL